MNTIFRWMKGMVLALLLVTGLLAMGAAFGSQACLVGLSLVTQGTKGLVLWTFQWGVQWVS
jgi:hypothetical protein